MLAKYRELNCSVDTTYVSFDNRLNDMLDVAEGVVFAAYKAPRSGPMEWISREMLPAGAAVAEIEKP